VVSRHVVQYSESQLGTGFYSVGSVPDSILLETRPVGFYFNTRPIRSGIEGQHPNPVPPGRVRIDPKPGLDPTDYLYWLVAMTTVNWLDRQSHMTDISNLPSSLPKVLAVN
jgi:hypothetical protein